MKRWLKPALVLLGFIAWVVLVWAAGPLIGVGGVRPFDPLWVRILLTALVALVIAVWGGLALLRRRRAARAMEAALTADAPTGDGTVLAEKMQAALATLKKSSRSKTFLYDLPWYVIIGPPGSGKTTALLNSGIKFPVADQAGGGLSGFGGTRYCDWWFAEDAILIDTAGRYTSQDSDAAADKSSWESFLALLKRNRPKQPINGVILAFSVEDLMAGDDESLRGHAETVRARLAEIHETLKVDFPVYVMFTKADLIAGFREYFGSFSAERRKGVWGATFQTSVPKETTHDRVPGEFDALVSRLSDEVLDRLSEEPDGAARIAIFGLPGQMALLRDKVGVFLKAVFEPTRYKTSAILRGFYFTSGTQEGTPIDQVLGAMGREFGLGAQGGFMSGKGKSFFLHDLLQKVIFAEAGWVSYDRGAVRRTSVLRIAAFSAMGLASVAALAAWGVSYIQNRALVGAAQAALVNYEASAREDLAAVEVRDTDFQRVANHLQLLRDMPAGFAAPARDSGLAEGFGLGQRGQLHAAARESYRSGLERLLRPRLILRVEEQLQGFVRTNETLAIYETLKVYKLLGGMAPAPEDAVIQAWFRADWRDVLYPGNVNAPLRNLLEQHLAAMLELDAEGQLVVALNGDLIEAAETVLARMPVADRAYALIVATAEFAGIPDFMVLDRAGPDARRVFETVDGSDLSDLRVSSLFTYDGFNSFFLAQLAEVARKLDDEQWLLGDKAEAAGVNQQLDRLGPELLMRYREDYLRAWNAMLNNLRLAPLLADRPAYVALGAAASPATSPILRLVQRLSDETRLTAEPPAAAGGASFPGSDSVALARAEAEATATMLRRTSGLQRIGLEIALEAGKSQRRAGTAGGSGRGPVIPGEDIEAQFEDFHRLIEGTPGQRPIDELLTSLSDLQQSLVIAAGTGQAQGTAQMISLIGRLRTNASRLPPPLARMVGEMVSALEGDAANATIAQLNQDMATQVTRVCEEITANRFPFARNTQGRQVPLSEFTQLFGPDGVLDRFFNANLAAHADLTGRNWTWRQDRLLASASVATLRQFERADRIRSAFFPGRSPTINLEVTISQAAAHDQIREAVLEVNGQPVITRQVGNTPRTILWPATGASTSLQLLPEINNRASTLAYQGPWAFMQFLRDGRPTQRGDVMQVTYIIDGRNISYDIRVNALINPFNMSELAEFRCPAGL